MRVEAEWVGELKLIDEPMRRTLDSVETKLSTGTTIRLLRCRDETLPKTEGKRGSDGEAPKEALLKVTGTRMELCASYLDDKTKRYKDIVRMVTALVSRETMQDFLDRSVKEIEKHLPRFKAVDKIARTDSQTVQSYEDFAEALQRR